MPPTDQLRSSIDRVIRVLEDPELRKQSRTTERRAAVRKIASEIFDFTEITQRCLGPHWQARTKDEREEFTRLFTDLLERSYLGKVENWAGEKVVFFGEFVDGDYAAVRSKLVTTKRQEVPIEYRLYRVGQRWQAYDVLFEGVSFVATYRGQFNRIIQTTSFAQLVDRMRQKEIEVVTVERRSGKSF